MKGLLWKRNVGVGAAEDGGEEGREVERHTATVSAKDWVGSSR
jgi:hypothetical protein